MFLQLFSEIMKLNDHKQKQKSTEHFHFPENFT